MNLQKVTKEIIENFIDKKWSFTSLDISNAVKRENDLGKIRHKDIAPIVRSIYAMGSMIQEGYEQELIPVILPNGDQRQAYLYHHWSVDTSVYTNRTQKPIVPKSLRSDDTDDSKLGGATMANVMAYKAKPAPVVALRPVSAPVVVPTVLLVKRAQKRDHRLEIPASWVGDVGLSGRVYAIKTLSKLVIKNSNNVASDDNVVGTMLVNNDGRLRVTKKVLDRVFTSSRSGNELYVSKDSDTIVVEED